MSRGQSTAGLQKNSSNSHKQITYNVKIERANLNKNIHRTLREEITMNKSFVKTLSIIAICGFLTWLQIERIDKESYWIKRSPEGQSPDDSKRQF